MKKIEKKISVGIRVFGYGNKVKYPIHVSKFFCEDKHVDLFLIDEGEKKLYVLIKNFNIFLTSYITSRKKTFLSLLLASF